MLFESRFFRRGMFAKLDLHSTVLWSIGAFVMEATVKRILRFRIKILSKVNKAGNESQWQDCTAHFTAVTAT